MNADGPAAFWGSGGHSGVACHSKRKLVRAASALEAFERRVVGFFDDALLGDGP
jgi:hypothetical protein